jgi:hypothetical protein
MKAPGGFFGKIFGFLSKATSEEREKVEHELPFVVMIFTLLAASGSFRKRPPNSHVPTFRKDPV